MQSVNLCGKGIHFFPIPFISSPFSLLPLPLLPLLPYHPLYLLLVLLLIVLFLLLLLFLFILVLLLFLLLFIFLIFFIKLFMNEENGMIEKSNEGFLRKGKGVEFKGVGV